MVCVLGQHTFVHQPFANRARAGEGRVDLHADQQALAAHFGDRRVVQPTQLRHQVVSVLFGAASELFLLQQVQRRQPDGGSQRVAAEGAAVVAGGELGHHVGTRQECAHRQQPAAERFAQHQTVGFDAFVVAGQQRAGAAQAGLHFVADHQDVVARADLAHRLEVARRRHDDAGLTLDGLDEERGGVRRDRGVERSRVAKGHAAEAGRERAEAVAVLRFAGEADDRGGAAGEVAFGDEDVRPTFGHALDLVGPLARCLDGGLDRFGARVHRQRTVHAGHAAQRLQKGAEPVGVEGA